MGELTDAAAHLRSQFEQFLASPTGEGYRLLRNKLAEYYANDAARQEKAYAREQVQRNREWQS